MDGDETQAQPPSPTGLPGAIPDHAKSAHSPDHSFAPYIWMLFGSLSFALMGTITHALGPSCDWQVIALARSTQATVFALLLAKAAGAELVFWKPATLWMRSLVGSMAMVCTFFSLDRLPVSEVLTVTNMFPIWVALLSWPVLREVPTVGIWVAVAFGVAGVVLIQQPHFAEGNFASLATLLASFCTAVAMLGLHRLSWIDPRAIVAHFSGVATVVCFTAWMVFPTKQGTLRAWDSETLLLLAGVGASATIGQLFLTKAFALGQPARVSVVGLTQIVFSMIFDALLWRRTFGGLTLLGMGLIIAPTAWMLTHRTE